MRTKQNTFVLIKDGGSQKLVDKFTNLGSSVSFSTENDINTRLAKAWTAINRLLVIWKSVVVSVLLYGCTTCTLTKCMERKLEGNYTRMLRAVLNKSWRQHPTKTIQTRRTRHAGHLLYTIRIHWQI